MGLLAADVLLLRESIAKIDGVEEVDGGASFGVLGVDAEKFSSFVVYLLNIEF